MATQGKASLPVIKRLPKYYRYLNNLKQDGQDKVSSSELARMMGTTASQVRQDFNCFGGFGQQGIGYKVDVLLNEIGKLLFGDGERLPTILIGAGRLGNAVSSFIMRDTNGYRLIGAFDINPDLVGQQLHGTDVTVLPLSELEPFCEEYHPEVAVLCLPRQGAREVSGELVELGIRGFWNFSHYDLSVSYPGVTVENVHLGDSLMSLGYRLRNQ
ncbi:MAG: redox-sensing transcriptional repressor Rex [Gemmiger sp.]